MQCNNEYLSKKHEYNIWFGVKNGLGLGEEEDTKNKQKEAVNQEMVH